LTRAGGVRTADDHDHGRRTRLRQREARQNEREKKDYSRRETAHETSEAITSGDANGYDLFWNC
jgi:hypothetical protein